MSAFSSTRPFAANGVVAHRGAFGEGRGGRNSLTAFRDAIAAGYGAFECDLSWSSDEVVFAAHGPLSGSEDADGEHPLRTTPWATLAECRMPTGEGFCTLEQVLALVRTQSRTGVVLEIKAPGDGSELALAERVVRAVAEHEVGDWVRYISFSYPVLQRILALEATSHCAPLQAKSPGCRAAEYRADGMKGVDFNVDDYANPDRGAGEKTVAAFKAVGLEVNTWTVDDEASMRRLIGWGVDQITTDEPALLQRVWAERGRST